MEFVFTGSEADLHGTALKRFGQRINLELEQAKKYSAEGVSLVPVADWNKCGFTDAELQAWPTVALQNGRAPESFLAKRKAAWAAAHDFRFSVTAPDKEAK